MNKISIYTIFFIFILLSNIFSDVTLKTEFINGNTWEYTHSYQYYDITREVFLTQTIIIELINTQETDSNVELRLNIWLDSLKGYVINNPVDLEIKDSTDSIVIGGEYDAICKYKNNERPYPNINCVDIKNDTNLNSINGIIFNTIRPFYIFEQNIEDSQWVRLKKGLFLNDTAYMVTFGSSMNPGFYSWFYLEKIGNIKSSSGTNGMDALEQHSFELTKFNNLEINSSEIISLFLNLPLNISQIRKAKKHGIKINEFDVSGRKYNNQTKFIRFKKPF